MPFIKKTFTLIELLVVVVIIGVLAAALIPRIQDASKRARDAIRIKDVKTAGDALSIYFLDEKKMPMTTQQECLDGGGEWTVAYSYCNAGGDNFLKVLVPKYLTTVLKDPLTTNVPYSITLSDITNSNSIFLSVISSEGCPDIVPDKYRYYAQINYKPEIPTIKDRIRACPNGMPRDISLGSSRNAAWSRFWPFPAGDHGNVSIVSPLWLGNATTPPKDIPMKLRMRGMFLFDGQNFYFGEPNVRHAVDNNWYRDSGKQKYCKKADNTICGDNGGYEY